MSKRARTGKYKFIIIIITVVFLILNLPGAYADNSDERGSTSSGQVVVLYEENKNPTTRPEKNKTSLQRSPASEKEDILEGAIIGDYSMDDTIVLKAADDRDEDMVVGVVSADDYSTEELVEVLNNTEGIVAAEPNYRFEKSSLPGWNDAFINDSWHLGESGINLIKAPIGKNTEPIVLAVMDSGIAYDHPDLKARMWTAPTGFGIGGEHGVDYSDYDNDPYDEDGHGTHCAGVIAAESDNGEGIAGITGKNAVQVMAVRVLDKDGGGNFADIIKAYEYLIEAKNLGVNIKAVNCSFGSEGKSTILDSIINRAGENGIITIAAAGNESQSNDVNEIMPANADSQYVISVASVDEDGGLASYSNYGGNSVDIAAPGSNILSSVSYTNYAPYLYDADRIRATTQVYGEFGEATVDYNPDTAEQSVQPSLGSSHKGTPIDEVEVFGNSHSYSMLTDGSKGESFLSITGGDEPGAFPIGNNQKSLRWTIKDASYGDKFILFFPYYKNSNSLYANMVLRTHSDFDENDGGSLCIGDIAIEEDSQGITGYRVSSENSGYILKTDRTYNSLWHASELTDALYSVDELKGMEYGTYGFGLVYEAWEEGNMYVDISSLAIAVEDAEKNKFGKYDVMSGTSMAAPVVTGSLGVVAAANPEIGTQELKTKLLSTAVQNKALSGKCMTSAKVDFSAYRESEMTPSGNDSKAKDAALAATSNINKATVTAKDIKKASELGAATVTLGAKVKKVKKNAFKGTNIKTIVVKTKKLKAKSVKGSLKGSKVKTVKVEIGSKKVNKKFVKKYKKIFTKKNAGKKAKVK